MKVFLYKSVFFLSVAFPFFSCNSTTEAEKPINQDSIINALNAADTIPKVPQKVTDSINKAYLDSFKKNVDTNNAEFGHPH
jgi:hypothetical protein